MSYRTWYDPPRKGDEEPFPGSSDDMMDTIAALRVRIEDIRKANEGMAAERDTLRAENDRLRGALDQAEAVLSIVEPRSDKAEYLRILGVVRAALEDSPARSEQ